MSHRAGRAFFRRFRDAVEEDFRVHHDVAHYGRRLGYSPRTLSRSVRAATGRGAKEYLSERLLLEAKRLLAHDRLSPARCGQRLSLADASNFSAFFLREAGVRPRAWQAANPPVVRRVPARHRCPAPWAVRTAGRGSPWPRSGGDSTASGRPPRAP